MYIHICMYVCIYIYIYIHTYICTYIQIVTHLFALATSLSLQVEGELATSERTGSAAEKTPRADLRAKILAFGGFDSSIILISRGGIPRAIGNFPEIMSQRIFVWIILVGRLGAGGRLGLHPGLHLPEPFWVERRNAGPACGWTSKPHPPRRAQRLGLHRRRGRCS